MKFKIIDAHIHIGPSRDRMVPDHSVEHLVERMDHYGIDLTGKPLGEALYTRVALEKEIGPYIAVRPVNHEGEKHSPSAWKMTNAMDSWSWRGCEGRRAFVEVYARAARVGDEMENKGIVGPFQGSKPRAILVTKEQWQAMRSGQSAQMDFDDLQDSFDGDSM